LYLLNLTEHLVKNQMLPRLCITRRQTSNEPWRLSIYCITRQTSNEPWRLSKVYCSSNFK
jgi:hypothetical protein